MSIRIFLFAALACATSLTYAKAKPESVPMDPREFIAMREDIEAEIRKSDAFREMDLNERKEISRALDRMEATLSTVESVDDLDPPAKTQLFNDQELLNHALTKAQADDKVICQRTKKVGSNMYTNTCLTVGERRRSQESVEHEFQRMQREFPKEAK
jgi:hypothetical protein